MRKLYILGLIALAAIIIGVAWAEQITLTTYYPAPYGVYRQMQATISKLEPSNGPPAFISGSEEEGMLYFDDGTVNVKGPYYWDSTAASWVSLGGAGGGRTTAGTYLGDGSATGRQITGLSFRPKMVILMQTQQGGTQPVIFKVDNMSRGGDGKFCTKKAPGGLLVKDNNNGILDIISDGFSIGKDNSVNANGHKYYYLALE